MKGFEYQVQRKDDSVRFPTLLCVITLVLTLATFAWVAWNAYAGYREADAFRHRDARGEELRGIIVHLDEVLTMSARMAAATGDVAWEKRYRRYEPELDAAIKEALALTPGSSELAPSEQTAAANAKLVAMEGRAFAFVRNQRREDARAVLFAPAYEEQKKLYALCMTQLLTDVRSRIDTSLHQARQRALMSTAGSGLLFMLSIAVWIAVIGSLRRTQNDLERQIGERTAALTQSNRTLVAETAERKQSEERYRNLFEANPLPMWIYDLETLAFLEVNDAAVSHYGYEREEFLSMTIADIRPNADKPPLLANVAHAANRAVDHAGVWKHRKKDGSLIDVEITSHVLDHSGRRAELVLAFDVTERQRADAERQVISEIVQGIITTTNLDELLELAWRSIGKVLYAEDCFVGLHDAKTDLIHFELWIDKFDSVPPPQPISNGFTRSSYVLRTGQPLLLTSALKAQLFDQGKLATSGSDSASWLGVPLRTPTRTIGVLAVQHYEKEGAYNQHDLEFLSLVGDQIALAIERKRAEETLRESEEKFRQLADNITDVFWITSPDLKIMHYVSAGYELIWGRATESLYANPHQWIETILPEDREHVFAVFGGLMENEPQVSVEYRIARPDGSIRWVHDRGFQVRDAGGRLVRLTGICTDITERIHAEERIAEQAALIDHAQDAILVRDLDNVIRFWNKSAERLYGWTAEEAIGSDAAGLLYNDTTQFVKAQRIAVEEGSWIGELLQKSKDGRKIAIEGRWTLVRDEQGRPKSIFAINTDITVRNEAEQAQARFATIMEMITDFVGVADPEGRVLYVNPAGRRMMGFDAQEDVTTTTIADYSAKPDLHRIMHECIPTAIQEGVWSGESTFLSREGREIPISQVVMAHKAANGEVEFLATTACDLTERKKAEAAMEEATRQLLESSRQAGMAEVATNVLHNVGNVLNSVNISCSVISDRVRKSPIRSVAKTAELLHKHADDLTAFFTTDPIGRKLPNFLDKLSTQLSDEQTAVVAELQLLSQNIEHIKDIVSVQQSHAGHVGGVRETLACEGLMEDALRINEGSLKRHQIAILREYSEAPPISLEKHKVLQILVNLVRNAKQALNESDRPDKRLTVQIGRNNGDVAISVNDNGTGIAPENLTRIFAHGFTTRKDGHGFGLHSGVLAAQEMGGKLTVHSDGLGLGATFTLKLPVGSNANN